MGLLLYNPMEAAIILLFVCFSEKKKICTKDFFFLSYIVGTVFLFLQSAIPQFSDTIFFGLINLILDLVIYPISLKIILNNRMSFKACFFGFLFYVMSMDAIVRILGLPIILADISKNLATEFFGNICIRSIQILLLLLLYGGTKMLKKMLVKNAKENVKSTIAATVHGWGEPKLSKKLQDEIK